jgi:hypothetical protein
MLGEICHVLVCAGQRHVGDEILPVRLEESCRNGARGWSPLLAAMKLLLLLLLLLFFLLARSIIYAVENDLHEKMSNNERRE